MKCTGIEKDLLYCKPNENAKYRCTSHRDKYYQSQDANVKCVRPQWGGLIFPAKSKESELRHVKIDNAGYSYKYEVGDSDIYYFSRRIKTHAAVRIHLYNHVLENLNISSSYYGIEVSHANTFTNFLPASNITITDCTGGATRFDLKNATLDCRHHGHNYLNDNKYMSRLENDYKNVINNIPPSDKLTACYLNRTINTSDLIILSPPYHKTGGTTRETCNGEYVISNADDTGRVGIVLLHSSQNAQTTVEEDGNILLTVNGEFPTRDTIWRGVLGTTISTGSTVVIRHQSLGLSYYYGGYSLYIMVMGVEADYNKGKNKTKQNKISLSGVW